MIVVATADFERYHEVVGELRERGVDFTTVEPGDPVPERAAVVVAGPEDAVGEADAPVVRAGAGERGARRAVEEALGLLRGGGGRTVVGIDPGTRPGIAVLAGDVVVAVFQVPAARAADVVRDELDGAVAPVVRIGDGARLEGTKIIDDLEDVRVELVDETGTTPSLGSGTRGMGDVLAAVNIARLEGEVIENRHVEPTAGEIQVIKNRSRERSGNETLPEDLARAVAVGDLTLEEAIAQHGTGEVPDRDGTDRD